MKKLLLATVLFLGFFNSYSQETTNLRQNALKVYLDCQGFCDLQYIKDHINYVNYVRDAYAAEVYILIVSEQAGNNGERYSLIFEGQQKYKGMNDTLRFFTTADNTDDEIRSMLMKYLEFGLVRYISRTDMANYLNVKVELPQDEAKKNVSTNWNNWIFKLSASAFGNGESSYKNTHLRTSFSGSRITEDWIIDFSMSGNWNFSQYQITDDYIYHSNTVSKYFNSMVVKSLTDHWSAGFENNIKQSTYSNISIGASFKPGIEYNLFPYSESTVHQMRVLYSVGPEFYKYMDTTIFDKTEELLWRQKISLAYEIVKKWGSVSVDLEGGTYLHDFTKNSYNIFTNLNIRITKGLSLYVSGSFGVVHDQLYLPKGGASLEEILTRQQALATQYNYFVSIGISYTFGDIFNNVVNPRFGNSGGGSYYFFY